MIRYCLKPRTKAAIEREAAKYSAKYGALAMFEKYGSHCPQTGETTPTWAREYMSLPCVKEMTPKQAERDLAAHLKRWKEERNWGKGPGALDLGRWKGEGEAWT